MKPAYTLFFVFLNPTRKPDSLKQGFLSVKTGWKKIKMWYNYFATQINSFFEMDEQGDILPFFLHAPIIEFC